MQTATTELSATASADAREWLRAVREGLESLTLAPYLGPAASTTGGSPASYDQLAEFFGKKVALPKRARGNPWASAQYVEGQKLRASVTRIMAEAFSTPVAPESSSVKVPSAGATFAQETVSLVPVISRSARS